LLELGPHGCFVAEYEGRVVGTVTIACFERKLAWIGMMLVHPDFQGRGIGRKLMSRALDHLASKSIVTIKLDATPQGRPLYEKLGFVAEWPLARWICHHQESDPAEKKLNKNACRFLRDEDWSQIAALDAAVIGARREDLLRSLARDSKACLTWPEQGNVLGWGLLRPGAYADYLGPIACETEQGAIIILESLLASSGDRSVIWDIPDENEVATEMARKQGFSRLRPLTRMRLGPPLQVGTEKRPFAIADPALG
jgi:GNAT superfamily N-acetyltransferase